MYRLQKKTATKKQKIANLYQCYVFFGYGNEVSIQTEPAGPWEFSPGMRTCSSSRVIMTCGLRLASKREKMGRLKRWIGWFQDGKWWLNHVEPIEANETW